MISLSAYGTPAFGRRACHVLLGAVILTLPLFGSLANGETVPAQDDTRVRLETRPIADGAELWTVFVALPPHQSHKFSEMPVLSVIRDTLGESDPECARMRDVWLLTAGRASVTHRVASAIPFLYLLHTPRPSDSPEAVRLLDFGNPARQTEVALLSAVVQGEMLDPAGRALRTTSRSYRMNDAEDRGARAAEAVAALAEVEDDPATPTGAAGDLERLHARLLLTKSLFGGLVRDQRLASYHDRDATETTIYVGHNWDLLRQVAETDRLYFEPLSFYGREPQYAMLWVRRQDLATGPPRFDGRLLHIADPFRSASAAHWRGYTERWSFDDAGRRVDPGQAGATVNEVIPLALYSLGHPHVPQLLVNFQDSGAPRRRESAGQAAEEVTSGILGLSPITHWNYFLARTVIEFVRRRHGAVSDRTERVRAWAELSYALSTGAELRPGLRDALARHIHVPVFDEQQERLDREASLAWKRYERLTGQESPLPAIVQKRRESEQRGIEHNSATRFAFAALHAATLGAWSHRESVESAELEWARRMSWNRDFLDSVARSTPAIEVTWDTNRVRDSLDEVNRLVKIAPVRRDDISPVLARVAMNTEDDGIRHLCLRALNTMATDRSRRVLASLSERSDRFDCPVCRQYLARKAEPAGAAASQLAGAQ